MADRPTRTATSMPTTAVGGGRPERQQQGQDGGTLVLLLAGAGVLGLGLYELTKPKCPPGYVLSSSGTCQPSGCASGVLPAPSCTDSSLVVPSVLSVASNGTAALLSWSDPAGGASSFDIYKSTCVGGVWVPNGRIAAGVQAFTYTDTDVTSGGVYTYVMECVIPDPSHPNGYAACPTNTVQITI